MDLLPSNYIGKAHIESGRLKPDTLQNNPKIDRGIAIHNRLVKFFSDHFGSGTIKANIKGKNCYLSKGSCYKILNVTKQDAPKSNDELISAINAVFNKSSSTPLGEIPNIREEFRTQKEKTRAAEKLCKSYLKDNQPTGTGAASLLNKSVCLNNQRPDDPNYVVLKEELEKNILLHIQLFSNLYDSSLKNKDDLYISNQIKLIVIDLGNFYASREEALETVKQNCSPEFLDAISEEYPIPKLRDRSLAQIVTDNEFIQQSHKINELMQDCRDYLNGKFVSTGDPRADFLARNSFFAKERPDDPEYTLLRNDLEKNLLNEMQLFSKFNKVDDKHINTIKSHLMRFYPTRDEALTVLEQNGSPEVHDAVAKIWTEITPENFEEERKKWLDETNKILNDQ